MIQSNFKDWTLEKIDDCFGVKQVFNTTFCLNEYKKGTDPNGDPRGQALIAMLVAQKLNENKFPIYGCYVIGRNWYFMILEEKEYAISNDFSCVNDEVFDIYKILKNLTIQIENVIS